MSAWLVQLIIQEDVEFLNFLPDSAKWQKVLIYQLFTKTNVKLFTQNITCYFSVLFGLGLLRVFWLVTVANGIPYFHGYFKKIFSYLSGSYTFFSWPH